MRTHDGGFEDLVLSKAKGACQFQESDWANLAVSCSTYLGVLPHATPRRQALSVTITRTTEARESALDYDPHVDRSLGGVRGERQT